MPDEFDSGEFPKSTVFFPLLVEGDHDSLSTTRAVRFIGLLLYPLGRNCFFRIGKCTIMGKCSRNGSIEDSCKKDFAHTLLHYWKEAQDEGTEITLV